MQIKVWFRKPNSLDYSKVKNLKIILKIKLQHKIIDNDFIDALRLKPMCSSIFIDWKQFKKNFLSMFNDFEVLMQYSVKLINYFFYITERILQTLGFAKQTLLSISKEQLIIDIIWKLFNIPPQTHCSILN